jgi:myosin phosphatase Rho-interacting protein
VQEKERKSRWTMSEVQLDETPTRDEMTNKQKRPQSLSIVSSTPSIISVVKKKPLGTEEIITYRKSSQSIERGDPDGDCGMENSPASCCNKTAELRVKLPSEEILHNKSGWLMKEDRKEWSKYWFSLKGGGLFYYRDPAAEERGVLDGVLDVNSITSIKETTTNRNHAFQLTVINVLRHLS